MTDSISAVNSTSTSSATTTSSSSTALTEETKKKLQALGVDTTNITTEAEGQTALTTAQAAQAAQAKQTSVGTSETSIKTDASTLASELGVAVGNNDTIDTILANISTQIDVAKASSGDDKDKTAQADSYETQYEELSSQYSQLQASRSMTGATALASYNKAALALAA